ncbi:general odorant-binding protein 28a-like [Aricia agestis]|uniref:general odorant-binding protein 28a-like n=1 Tax=Aricia agestis TaxID=91739 RepID=UPI001C204067|nr:general odorant-binding protein 28a-like [Aricia agestis]
MLLLLCVCLLSSVHAGAGGTLRGTLVDFTNPRVLAHIESLARMGVSCVVKTKPPPSDVRAYLTNSPATTHRGKCFVACMLESSDVLDRGRVDTDMLVELASLINGRNSRVVQSLSYASRECLRVVTKEVYKDQCEFGSKYNDCLNDNMREFRFPEEIANELLKVMPYHRISPDLL